MRHFQGPFGPLVWTFCCRPSPNFEGNWPDGSPYFDPWPMTIATEHTLRKVSTYSANAVIEYIILLYEIQQVYNDLPFCSLVITRMLEIFLPSDQDPLAFDIRRWGLYGDLAGQSLSASGNSDIHMISRVDAEVHLEVVYTCNALTVSDSPTSPDIGTSWCYFGIIEHFEIWGFDMTP